MIKKKSNLYIAICLVIFAIIALLYASPVLTGKELIQPDIVHYKGGAKELLDYRENNGKETYWSNSMFSGMPTYQTGAQFRGDVIKQVDYLLNFLPRPANYIFLLFSGFFLLGLVATKKWKYALLGATFFGLSTYFYIIIAAGHNGKVHTIAYLAPLLAGILLVYTRKQYLLGFIVTTLFMGLQIASNHPQMTFYLFLALGFLFLSELIRAAKKYTTWKHFGISSAVLALAFLLGVGMNSQRLMANMEYMQETVRGKQLINDGNQKSGKSGLDKESLMMWSYGRVETLNLFIPGLMGGASQDENAEQIIEQIQIAVQENARSQREVDNISKALQPTSYWGEQPFTAGPAYQGAVVVFLAILGFFFAEKKYRYWILGASILTVLLAWGSNFRFLTELFIDYVPMYNKFRAPSSILVILELLFPLIAILGLYQFFNDEKKSLQDKRKLLMYVGGTVLGITLFLIVFGKYILGFQTDLEKEYLPRYVSDLMIDYRYGIFKKDAILALIYVSVTVGVLWFSLKQKVSQNVALLVIGLISFIDLWSVDRQYLNNDNYVDQAFVDNPFQTEESDLFYEKAMESDYVASLIGQVRINKVLETISEKDKTNYRIFNTTLSPFSETNTSYFKSSIGGYHAVKLRRYDDVINKYFSQNDTVKVPRILNMLNAKYLVVGNSQNPEAIINPYTNGNAWFVSDVKWAKNPNEEIKAIGEIDNKNTAVVSVDDKAYMQGKNLVKDSTAFIDLKRYEANEIEFSSKSRTPQLAVFSEIYYPHGWKFYLDGNEVPYIKANYLLRALYVPQGEHTIKMVFEPEVISTGKTISIAFTIIFILLSSVGIWFEYKKRKSTESEVQQ